MQQREQRQQERAQQRQDKQQTAKPPEAAKPRQAAKPQPAAAPQSRAEQRAADRKLRTEQRDEVRKLQAEQRKALREKDLSRDERKGLRAEQRKQVQELRDKQKAARSEQARPDAAKSGQAADSREPAAESRSAQREAQKKLRAEQRKEVRELQAEQRKALRDKDLSRDERRKLRAEQRKELRGLQAKQKDVREERQKDAREQRRNAKQNLVGDERRDQAQRDQPRDKRAAEREQRRKLRAENREQRREARRAQATADAQDRRRIDRNRLVSRQDARQGRFAAAYYNDRAQRRADRRADRQARRLARIIARQAWRRGHHAHFVAWVGPVFWPYAYTDIFYYTFWPYAYDHGYWAYAYDDFFTSVFWAYPPDYYEDIYAGPYYASARTTTGVSRSQPVQPSREVRRAVEKVCEPAKGLAAWPFEEIEKAVDPSDDQIALLGALKEAANEAAETFKANCDPNFAMTPPGRLDGMINRLNATLEAVLIVRPPLEEFYNSLNDEQKARFNSVGPKIGAQEAKAARDEKQDVAKNNCGEAKPGLTNLPMKRIEDVIRPSAEQEDELDRLSNATADAVDALQAACPDVIALTPVGRMEAMENRLMAMLDAAETVQPALEEFYAVLSNEQKARFNTLGRDVARRD